MINRYNLLDTYGDLVEIQLDSSYENVILEKGYKPVEVDSYAGISFVTPEDFEDVKTDAFIYTDKDVKLKYRYKYAKKHDIYVRTFREGNVSKVYTKNLESLKLNEIFKETGSDVEDGKPKINLLGITQRGFVLNEYELNQIDIDLENMYNDNFKPVYDHVIEKLNKDQKGIVLFYGLPGTGKTSIIKHLTSKIKDSFIFIPPNLITRLTDPEFTSFLSEHPKSILVIEDCENYIKSRELGDFNVVSSLLQLTDGFLSDILGIRVICTFNTDISEIDEALLRPGRLIAEYKFEELTADKFKETTVEGQRTLANIFNNLTLKNNKVTNRTKIGY